jgi:hypothetical protein
MPYDSNTPVRCEVIASTGVVLTGKMTACVLGGRLMFATFDGMVSGRWSTRGEPLRLMLTPRTQPGGGTTWLLDCAQCARRCRALYETAHTSWRCRGCHGLAYRTQRMRPAARLEQRAARLRVAAGATPEDEADASFPALPPRGRWSSRFEQMRATHDALVDEAEALRILPLLRFLLRLKHRRSV